MPRNAATNRFRIRNQNASIFINGTDGAAGNALSIANNASLSPTAAVTLEIRFRPTARKAAILFDNSTLGVTNSYYLSISADGGLLWYSTIGGVAKNIIGTTTKVKFNEWNMVNATYDGAAIKLFLNGSQLAETLAATGSMGTNSGPLRIGAYYSGGTSQTFQGSISQPRVYAAGCTLAEHQDRYYRSITSAALQAALVLDLNTEIGAGSTVTDLSGLGNNATMGASASWTSDSPFKSRKASVNANMVKNGDFEYAPPFTAATSTTSRWVDGSAAGSTTNDLFAWLFTVNGTGTVGNASFDTTVFRSGSKSIKIVSTTGSTGAANPGLCVSSGTSVGPTVIVQDLYLPRTSPNTTYKLSGYIKTDSISANGGGARLRTVEYSGVSTSGIATNNSSFITGTNDWTYAEIVFTTSSTTRHTNILLQLDTSNSTTGTAWFDDIVFTPVYPEGRVPANGNLLKNFDFEVAPTFVAATNTVSRWIEGSAAGSTTNATYKWALEGVTGTVGARFDTSEFNSGATSMKLSTLATGALLQVSPERTNSATDVQANPIALASTSYTYSFWMKTNYVSGDSSDGAFVAFKERSGAGTNTVTTNSTKVKTTTGWTQYTGTFTTNAATVFISPQLTITGNTGAATLIMDAWFDDIYLAPTTNPGRVIIT